MSRLYRYIHDPKNLIHDTSTYTILGLKFSIVVLLGLKFSIVVLLGLKFSIVVLQNFINCSYNFFLQKFFKFFKNLFLVDQNSKNIILF